MGTLFNTCLSPDGCNAMSVLANAAHANKQVLYVSDEKNQVVARKLLSVSHTNELLGYCFYQPTEDVVDDNQRGKMLDFVSAYCGCIAARVGWELGDEGSPTWIGHFWYDDGEEAWNQATRNAWSDARESLAIQTIYLCD